MYNTEGFSNRDKKILRENPNLTAYGLMLKGLSDKGYERLIQQQEVVENAPAVAPEKVAAVEVLPEPEKAKDEAIQPAKVEKVADKVHQPKVSSAMSNQPDGTVILKGPTGIAKPIPKRLADRLIEQDPTNYKIVG